MAQRVQWPRVPADAPRGGPPHPARPPLDDPLLDDRIAGFALTPVDFEPDVRPNRRRRREEPRPSLWGVDLRSAADVALLFAVVLLLLASIAAAAGLIFLAP